MEVTARARFVRIAPRKIRRYAKLIVGRPISEAQGILSVQASPAARILSKVIRSAAHNAENNDDLDQDTLRVIRATADDALTMPRWRPRARGMGYRIRKRTSHVTVVLDDSVIEEKTEEK